MEGEEGRRFWKSNGAVGGYKPTEESRSHGGEGQKAEAVSLRLGSPAGVGSESEEGQE